GEAVLLVLVRFQRHSFVADEGADALAHGSKFGGKNKVHESLASSEGEWGLRRLLADRVKGFEAVPGIAHTAVPSCSIPCRFLERWPEWGRQGGHASSRPYPRPTR